MNAFNASFNAFVRGTTASLDAVCRNIYYRRIMLGGLNGGFRVAATKINSSLEKHRELEKQRKTLEKAQADATAQQAQVIDWLKHGLKKLARTLESQAKAMDEHLSFFRIDEVMAVGGGGRPQRTPRALAPQPSAAASELKAARAAANKPVPTAAAADGIGSRRVNPVACMQSALAEAWKDF